VIQQLVVCAIGQNEPKLLKTLSKAIIDCGGNIMDSRMTILGGEFTLIMLLSGSWDTIVKIEALLPRLQDQLALTMITKRTESLEKPAHLLPYVVEVVALYHSEIVYEITRFFINRNIHIEDMVTNYYTTAKTDTPMFSLTLAIHIPATTSIATLRGEFMDLCDELNLDSVMGPVK
jgi:glycine cleavage system transcriptional repressor